MRDLPNFFGEKAKNGFLNNVVEKKTYEEDRDVVPSAIDKNQADGKACFHECLPLLNSAHSIDGLSSSKEKKSS